MPDLIFHKRWQGYRASATVIPLTDEAAATPLRRGYAVLLVPAPKKTKRAGGDLGVAPMPPDPYEPIEVVHD